MAHARDEVRDAVALYERDFVRWAEEQARLLREGRFAALDIPNLVEEVEDLSRREKKGVRSNLIVVLTHLLKYQHQPRRRSRSWRASIVEHRRRLRDDLADSPSLRPYAQAELSRCYADAREAASAETGLEAAVFPEACPWALEQVLDPDFLPA